MQVHEFFL